MMTGSFPCDGYVPADGALVLGYKLPLDAMLVACETTRQCDHEANLGEPTHAYCPTCGKRNRVAYRSPVEGFRQVCPEHAYMFAYRWHCVRYEPRWREHVHAHVIVLLAAMNPPVLTSNTTELPLAIVGEGAGKLREAFAALGMEWDGMRVGAYVMPAHSYLPSAILPSWAFM